VTLGGIAPGAPSRRAQFMTLADAGLGEVLVRTSSPKGFRSYAYMPLTASGAHIQSDVLAQTTTLADLDTLAGPGTTVTYTMMPTGTGIGMLDRDRDGFLDGDERIGCSDPSNPASTPMSSCRFNLSGGDGSIDGKDLAILLSNWGGSGLGDLDCDGIIGGADLSLLIGAWGECG
jgi:hypothetical protein